MRQNPNPAGFHPHFSTWLAGSDQLDRTLAGNHDILRDFLARLRSVEQGSPANHFLLVGPRGIGKTHLICLGGHYASGQITKPKDWIGPLDTWICAFFTEEEYAGQNSLANFLLTLFSKLGEMLPMEELWHLPKTLQQEADRQVVDCCFERLERFHNERKTWMLVQIDNLQKLLGQWSEDDHQRLRGFLSRNNLLVILGSAPSVFREVIDQKAAFHDFFEIRILSELSNEQVLDLLSRRFQEDGRGVEYNTRKEELSKKIPAITVLTGGNPRLVLFLYEIATRSTFLDIEVALRQLIEGLREYFVHRFDELPDQARKVLDTIAQMAGPATPKEIAREARLQPALVNAQLKRLKEGHYVRPVKFKRQKSTRYDISERLFRIWRQTATVVGRQRFRFLADFLKIYFTAEEVRSLYTRHLEFIGGVNEHPREEIIQHIDDLYYFQAAGEGEIRYGAFSNRIESLAKLGELRWAEEEIQHFAAESLRSEDKMGIASAFKLRAMIHTQSGQYADAVADVYKLVDAGAYQEAVVAADKLVAADPKSSDAWICLGQVANKRGDYEGALKALHHAEEVGQPTSVFCSLCADTLIHLQRYEEALKYAEQAVAVDDKNASAWSALGFSAFNIRNYARALAAFRKVAEIIQPSSESWLAQATLLLLMNQPGEALNCCEQAVAMDNKNVVAWATLGYAADMMGGYERALAAYRKAAECDKPRSDLWLNQAFILLNLKRPNEALKCCEQAVILDENNAKAWTMLGFVARKMGMNEQALAAFRKASEMDKPSSDLWLNQAAILLDLERPSEAVKCSEIAMTIDEKEADAWKYLGVAACKMGDNERALAAFRKAAELGQSTSEIWLLQAKVFFDTEQYDNALRCCEQALAIDEKNASAWIALGVVIRKKGHHDRALAAFRKAVEVNKPSADLSFLQAITLRDLERLDEALKCCEQAVEMNEKDVTIWLMLGIMTDELGYYERALAAFRKVAELGKGDGDSRRREACILRKLGRFSDSMAVLDLALASDSENPNLWREKAWTLLELSRIEEAMDCLKQARQNGIAPAEYHRDRGYSLLLSGRYAESLKDFDEAVAVEPGDWKMQTMRLIATGCLGQQGPLMEALPIALAGIRIPPSFARIHCEFVYDMARNALLRGENSICLGLLRASLEMKTWIDSDWFGTYLGNFLRRALDTRPARYVELVQLVCDGLEDERILQLLDPFLKAGEFLATKKVTIIERLFPEVRELVMEIVQRVDPTLHAEFKRLVIR